MKTVKIIIIALVLNACFFSCTPEHISDEIEVQACCDEGEHIPPPPPPIGG